MRDIERRFVAHQTQHGFERTVIFNVTAFDNDAAAEITRFSG